MLFNGVKIFSCEHEFVALPYGFLCHKCDHLRYELPIVPTKSNRSIIFFPPRQKKEEVVIQPATAITG